jgi:hypothetical protein
VSQSSFCRRRHFLAGPGWDTIGSIAGSGGGSWFLRKGLIAAQVVLSFLLLFGAGLFVRSLQNLKTTNAGFHDMDNLVTFQLSPALLGYDTPRVVHFYQELLERIRAVPGIRSAGLASVPVLHGWEWDSTTSVEGHQAKRRRGHAGVHELDFAGLFPDHGHSRSRGARLQRARH